MIMSEMSKKITWVHNACGSDISGISFGLSDVTSTAGSNLFLPSVGSQGLFSDLIFAKAIDIKITSGYNKRSLS